MKSEERLTEPPVDVKTITSYRLTHNKPIENGLTQPSAKGIAEGLTNPVRSDVKIAKTAILAHS